MGHEAFGVDLEALSLAEQGVRDAVAELGEMAGWEGSYVAKDGKGLVEGITDNADDVSTGELPGALTRFADAWNWGVRVLVNDGYAVADALRDTRSEYEKAEEAASDAVKYVLHAAFGNPMEDSTAWQDKSAGEIVSDLTPSLDGEMQRVERAQQTLAQSGMSVVESRTGVPVSQLAEQVQTQQQAQSQGAGQ